MKDFERANDQDFLEDKDSTVDGWVDSSIRNRAASVQMASRTEHPDFPDRILAVDDTLAAVAVDSIVIVEDTVVVVLVAD